MILHSSCATLAALPARLLQAPRAVMLAGPSAVYRRVAPACHALLLTTPRQAHATHGPVTLSGLVSRTLSATCTCRCRRQLRLRTAAQDVSAQSPPALSSTQALITRATIRARSSSTATRALPEPYHAAYARQRHLAGAVITQACVCNVHVPR